MAKLKFTLSIFAIFFVGCGSAMHMVKMEKFDRTSKDYKTLVRWSDFEAANKFTKATSPGTRLPDFQKLTRTKVTTYEVKKSVLSMDKKKILQVVEISYYKFDNTRIRTLRDHQVWEYDEEIKRWFLLSGLPDFR